jgi:hypothetical protein
VGVNLAYGALNPNDKGSLIALHLSKNTKLKPSRYDYQGITPKTLRRVVDLMEEHQILIRKRGRYADKRASSIGATDWFLRRMHEKGVSNQDFSWREGEEVIVLSSSTRSLGPDDYDSARTKKREDYRDTEVTRAYRAEMNALNGFLEGADVEFLDDGEKPIVLSQDRRLRRHFTLGEEGVAQAWRRGGRLFGGFWINLKKHRRGNIRISGEPVQLLDFSSMFLRLVYAHAEAVSLEDPDPYDLTGYLEGYDSDLHRSGVKKGFSSLLHGGKAGAREILDQLPRGVTAKRFRKAMREKHRALAEYLNGDTNKAIGMRLMFQESQILLRCLNELMGQKIVALPIHDGLLVAQSDVQVAEAAMKRASLAEVGVELPVQVKDATG